jgi:DNA invertase Pin-like site-specific DNA recombinase
MSDKISANHLRRLAYVCVRQSTRKQTERNRQSIARRYRLVQRAVALGWPADPVQTFDDDQALSGSGTAQRKGFESMTSEVALGRVGLILAIEVSRLVRNNSDWYRLLDLCGRPLPSTRVRPERCIRPSPAHRSAQPPRCRRSS